MSGTRQVKDKDLESQRRRGILYITISVLVGIIVTTILLGISPWENSLLIATLGIVDSALLAGFFLTLNSHLKPINQESKRENSKDHCKLCLVILISVLVVMLLMLMYVLSFGYTLYLPFAVVFAIASTVVTLTIAATIFKQLQLTSSMEALGLPKGTIRAIIALSLIVIFAIMIIFTQHQLSPNWKVFSSNVNVTYPNGTIVNYPNGTAILRQTTEAQKDFALQMLTTISTLVVAIVGFYFGTRAVEVARGVAPAPSLEIAPESPTELNLTINKEVDPIRATTTPENESVDFRIDKADGEIIRKPKANEFKYKPSEELVKEVTKTGKEKEVTLSFWLTKDPKTSASLRVKIQTTPTLKIADPGDTVEMEQDETKTIVLEATPPETTIVCKDYDKAKVESVKEDPNKKGTFKIKVKSDATANETTKVTFKLEDSEVEATLTINVKAKDK